MTPQYKRLKRIVRTAEAVHPLQRRTLSFHVEPELGTPRAFKSAAERQRIVRHLLDRESELMDVRHAVERGDGFSIAVAFGCVKAPVRLRELESDIATLRARLRELLDD
jgi:hypothetical protein